MIGRNAAALAVTALLVVAAPAAAQDAPEPNCSFQASGEELRNRTSPPDSASVTIGGETAKVCYSSPRRRGRDIMGGLVPYDQPWRLGANEPTTLHLQFRAEIGDVTVEPGSYSLYAVPGEEEWEIVVNGATDRWGVPIDEGVRSEDLGSVTVRPSETGSLVENLSLSFEPRGERTAHLVIRWERTRLEVPIQRADS